MQRATRTNPNRYLFVTYFFITKTPLIRFSKSLCINSPLLTLTTREPDSLERRSNLCSLQGHDSRGSPSCSQLQPACRVHPTCREPIPIHRPTADCQGIVLFRL